jgi:hypothetical protein
MNKLYKLNVAIDRHMSDFFERGVEGLKIAFCGVRNPFCLLADIGSFIFLLIVSIPTILVLGPFVLLNWFKGGEDA